jgi:LysM repeat protein
MLMSVVCAQAVGCGAPLVESGSVSTYPGAARAGETVSIGDPATNQNGAGVAIPSQLQGVPRVPASSAVSLPAREGEAVYHEVTAGETPASIARRYHTDVGRLLKLNGLDTTTELQRGQLLAIPQ